MKLLTWQRAALVIAVPAIGLGLAVPALAVTPAVPVAITDPSGDVYDDDDELADAPYADIINADGKKSGTNLVLTYKTAKQLDPVQDPNWDSDETYTDFLLDTNGDGTADYDVEYGVFEEEAYVDVYKLPAGDADEPVCSGTAAFTNASHTATIPLSCIGNPAKAGYRVETVYDQDVNSPDSLAAYDVAPETGFAQVG
ncbi:hypothetical protein GCM10010123_24930 [Pilimelia anulata]|uniref:Uncharacterized protein n=1 Tax=Pilimelia anulata TaxID=53371 RepID=A0A8J3B7P3_9ACTN|nr:hypothetical protein [Pilimelia anulata]GGJ94109.1 hypothetical protein GCM10010123_24930 [Pilimelia anulata]